MFGTTYLEKWKTIELKIPLIINELKDAFFSFEINKSHGQDGISFNGIKDCFVPLSTPLLNIFNLSLEKRIFPDELKIAKVTPIYKTGEENGLGNYRPISVLPCFFKILKRIMYKRLCNRITSRYIRNNLTFNRAVQQNRTFNCLLIKLILALKKKFFSTLGVFIDFSKVFDSVGHHILVSILGNYVVNGNKLHLL